MRVYSYRIYSLCLLINWTYQIYDILKYEFNIYRSLYILGLIPIINDDIILLSWLKRKKNKNI